MELKVGDWVIIPPGFCNKNNTAALVHNKFGRVSVAYFDDDQHLLDGYNIHNFRIIPAKRAFLLLGKEKFLALLKKRI